MRRPRLLAPILAVLLMVGAVSNAATASPGAVLVLGEPPASYVNAVREGIPFPEGGIAHRVIVYGDAKLGALDYQLRDDTFTVSLYAANLQSDPPTFTKVGNVLVTRDGDFVRGEARDSSGNLIQSLTQPASISSCPNCALFITAGALASLAACVVLPPTCPYVVTATTILAAYYCNSCDNVPNQCGGASESNAYGTNQMYITQSVTCTFAPNEIHMITQLYKAPIGSTSFTLHGEYGDDPCYGTSTCSANRIAQNLWSGYCWKSGNRWWTSSGQGGTAVSANQTCVTTALPIPGLPNVLPSSSSGGNTG